MVILGGGGVLMSEVTLYTARADTSNALSTVVDTFYILQASITWHTWCTRCAARADVSRILRSRHMGSTV